LHFRWILYSIISYLHIRIFDNRRKWSQYISSGFYLCFNGRLVWRYQRGSQNPSIIEGQTTQWPKEKVQRDKQRSTRHTYKTKDRVTRTPLKNRGWSYALRKVCSSCSTSVTRRANPATNPSISHERGKDRQMFTTSGTHPWSFVTQIFHNGQPSHGGDRKTSTVMTST
jgi:hypothetical protein